MLLFISSSVLANDDEDIKDNITEDVTEKLLRSPPSGNVQSRAISVWRKAKNKAAKRRRGGLKRLHYSTVKILRDPMTTRDSNIYNLDHRHTFAAQPQQNKTKLGKNKKNQKMPKIYLTKLPEEEIETEPEIFFSKLLTDNHSSVAIFQGLDRETMDNDSTVTIEDILVYSGYKDNVVISEDILEHAIRSDHLYQDGLENVNAMIFNSQVVNQPTHKVEDYVSSRGRAISDPCEGDENCDDKVTEEDLRELGSADNIQPATQSPNEGIFSSFPNKTWVLPVVIIASTTILLLLSVEVFLYLKSRRKTSGHRLLFCLSIQKLFDMKTRDDREAQNAFLNSLISSTFGSGRKTKNANSASFPVDVSIYSSEEVPSGTQLELVIQPRSQTMEHLARSVLTSSQTLHSGTNNTDRFPFSSRPPQFSTAQTSEPNQTTGNLYRVDSKKVFKPKPSLSNPNVLFFTPDEMPRSVIH